MGFAVLWARWQRGLCGCWITLGEGMRRVRAELSGGRGKGDARDGRDKRLCMVGGEGRRWVGGNWCARRESGDEEGRWRCCWRGSRSWT